MDRAKKPTLFKKKKIMSSYQYFQFKVRTKGDFTQSPILHQYFPSVMLKILVLRETSIIIHLFHPTIQSQNNNTNTSINTKISEVLQAFFFAFRIYPNRDVQIIGLQNHTKQFSLCDYATNSIDRFNCFIQLLILTF